MSKKEILKKEKGITLIALIITIVVLLILAGVTLNIVLNSGIINKSQTATSKYNEQATKEKLTLALTEYKFKQLAGETPVFDDIITNIGGDVTATTDTEWTIELDGFIFTVDKKTNAITSIEPANAEPLNPPIIGTPIVTLAGNSKSATIEVTVTPGNPGGILMVKIDNQNMTLSGGKYTLDVTTNGDKVITATEKVGTRTKTATAIAKVENIEEPEPMATIPDGNNLTGTSNGTLNGAASAYNNPVIPVGFKTSDAGASWALSSDGAYVTGWNDGLVITDATTDGNEFVWVPVDKTNVEFKFYYDIGNSSINSRDQGLPTGTNRTEERMVENYGGFYIARYEAGITLDSALGSGKANTTYRDIDGVDAIPVSKKNETPWNYISWTKAKTNSQKMYTFANTNNHLQSILITDKMWDTTIKWIENSGANVSSNSVGWGNCNNAPVTNVTLRSTDDGATFSAPENTTKGTSESWLLPTGHSTYTEKKHIYDMAGNLWEWTNSLISESSNALRGGIYTLASNSSVAANRANYSSIYTNMKGVGFRCALYIQ